jgi:hypothetical protein
MIKNIYHYQFHEQKWDENQLQKKRIRTAGCLQRTYMCEHIQNNAKQIQTEGMKQQQMVFGIKFSVKVV